MRVDEVVLAVAWPPTTMPSYAKQPVIAMPRQDWKLASLTRMSMNVQNRPVFRVQVYPPYAVRRPEAGHLLERVRLGPSLQDVYVLPSRALHGYRLDVFGQCGRNPPAGDRSGLLGRQRRSVEQDFVITRVAGRLSNGHHDAQQDDPVFLGAARSAAGGRGSASKGYYRSRRRPEVPARRFRPGPGPVALGLAPAPDVAQHNFHFTVFSRCHKPTSPVA